MVFLITLFDVGCVAALGALGATFAQVEAVGLRIGSLGLIVALIIAGFLFLKLPISLGPLDRLRALDVFRAPREARLGLLLELGLLRSLFVSCYVALTAGLLFAFGIEVGLVEVARNTAIMLVVSALPIAAGGLGTAQLVFVALFQDHASEARLLAASLVLSAGLVASRALVGALFAPEFTREALTAARAENASATPGRVAPPPRTSP